MQKRKTTMAEKDPIPETAGHVRRRRQAQQVQAQQVQAQQVQAQQVQKASDKISSAAAGDIRRDGNDGGEVVNLFNLMTPQAQARVMDYVAGLMHGMPVDAVRRRIEHFYKVDPDYAIGVAVRLRLSLADFDAAVTAK
jgi:catalase